MPVYEYRCQDCGELTESIRAMREADEPIACSHCGLSRTARVQSVFTAAQSGPASTSMAWSGGGQGGCGHCGDPHGPCAT